MVVSEYIDVNMTSVSIWSVLIIHYWHFLNNGFKFQPTVGHGCLDVLMMSIDIKQNIAIEY